MLIEPKSVEEYVAVEQFVWLAPAVFIREVWEWESLDSGIIAGSFNTSPELWPVGIACSKVEDMAVWRHGRVYKDAKEKLQMLK